MAFLGNTTLSGLLHQLLVPLGAMMLPGPGQFDVTSVAAPTTMTWSSCANLQFGWNQSDLIFPIQCARIVVPEDYSDSSRRQTTELQLLRVKALHEPSMGSIVINPGGPGESGVDYLALRGSRFHAILGGQFDLVSFDPRGTGNTTPFSCDCKIPFVPQADAPKLYRRQMEDVLMEKWHLYTAAAEECFATQHEQGRFMSTAFAARDMLQVVDNLGEDGMLRFWGSSYGTVLGMTFASMFPERVNRMLLDATVNPHEYMAGTAVEMLSDADSAYEAFLEECLVTPDRCSLTQLANTTSELSEIINEMLRNVVSKNEDGVTLYREIKNDIIYRSLYWPSSWIDLSNTLLDFVKGDFSVFKPHAGTPDPIVEYNKGSAAVFGTRCVDAALRASHAENLSELLVQQQQVSGFADVNTATSLLCAAWRIPAAERYEGNFTATTAHPLLFVNGRYDPASPLASARNASAGFANSTVLVHDGYGHGLSAHPNMCVGRTVRAYFLHGQLPEEGFACPRESNPFDLDMRAWQNHPDLLEIS